MKRNILFATMFWLGLFGLPSAFAGRYLIRPATCERGYKCDTLFCDPEYNEPFYDGYPHSSGGGWVYNMGGKAGVLQCQVRLPDNATITDIRLYAVDNSSVGNIEFGIGRQAYYDMKTIQDIAYSITSGAETYSRVWTIDSFAERSTVNNSVYLYTVAAKWNETEIVDGKFQLYLFEVLYNPPP